MRTPNKHGVFTQICYPLILNKKDNPKYPKILVYTTKLLYIKIEIKRETLKTQYYENKV